MARPTKEYDLTSKKARKQLEARKKGYYRTVGPGRSLGYFRRPGGWGSWTAREWLNGRYRERVIGTADDLARADGIDVFDFAQALRRATQSDLPPPKRAAITVADALDTYLTALAARSDHAKEARQRAELHILPTLGPVLVNRLTSTQLREWLGRMVRDDPQDPDARRRSQDTANRVLTILKAALNLAFEDEANTIASDSAWRRVKPFRNVGAAREDQFDAAQVRALLKKARNISQAFANLVEAGFLTGARLGELVGLSVRDFDAKRGTVAVTGKTGGRIVSLSGEAVALFQRLAEGKARDAALLPNDHGERWGKSTQHRPFKLAAKAARLPASASFYTLRHSHISRAIEAGMPLSLIAENCGTSLLMLQRNYAKVLSRTRRQVIEETSPRLKERARA